MNKPKSKVIERWFNVYLVDGEIVVGSVSGFKTEEEAKSMSTLNKTYLKTIKLTNETFGGNK